MEVSILKLHCIYLFIGISTLVLNLVLTIHMIRKYKRNNCKENRDCDEIITFSLTGGNSDEDVTTAAVPYEDTIPLK